MNEESNGAENRLDGSAVRRFYGRGLRDFLPRIPFSVRVMAVAVVEFMEFQRGPEIHGFRRTENNGTEWNGWRRVRECRRVARVRGSIGAAKSRRPAAPTCRTFGRPGIGSRRIARMRLVRPSAQRAVNFFSPFSLYSFFFHSAQLRSELRTALLSPRIRSAYHFSFLPPKLRRRRFV